MNKKVLIGLLVVVLVVLVVGVILTVKDSQSLSVEEKTEITALIEGFGKKLASVDKVAPDEVVVKSIKENYSPFLSSNLILKWTSNPSEALGRICSSPWPDRIEILSMKKLDANTVKVKGYVVWVTSGGENKLEVAEKVPTVLMVKRNPSTQKFLIDNVYSNEFAFYDGKTLLLTLKEAFRDLHVGELYEPFVERVVYVNGASSKPVAVVDMGTGGAYVEYYTICLPTNGHLQVANFKDKDGKVAPLFFDEGASIKHEAKLSTFDDGKGNFILYQSIIDKNDLGKIDNITVEAYKWNEEKKLFEYSEELSENIKNDLEEKISSKAVDISSLKFKEIKSDYAAIGAVCVYGDEVAFSCGSEKNRINSPSGTIKRIVIYNHKQNKVEFSVSMNKDWVNIDKIEMNDKWILFRAVENGLGAPTECFVINKKPTNSKLLSQLILKGNM